jgi:hypothetical protein
MIYKFLNYEFKTMALTIFEKIVFFSKKTFYLDNFKRELNLEDLYLNNSFTLKLEM